MHKVVNASHPPMGSVGEETVRGQHEVGLAAAEVGLESHYRVAVIPGKPLQGIDKQPPQAAGQVCAAEESDGASGARCSFTQVYLAEVGGKLRLPVTAVGHVPMEAYNLPPRRESPSDWFCTARLAA